MSESFAKWKAVKLAANKMEATDPWHAGYNSGFSEGLTTCAGLYENNLKLGVLFRKTTEELDDAFDEIERLRGPRLGFMFSVMISVAIGTILGFAIKHFLF